MTQCLSSASVERVMSTHSYLDTGERQKRSAKTRDLMVQLYKELPKEKDFDTESAVQIWAKMVPRRAAIPLPKGFPSAPDKHLVKPLSDILAARVKRNKRFAILANPDLNLAEITSEELDDVCEVDECELSQGNLPTDEDEGSASAQDTDWSEESDLDIMM